ncbi:hypothetical protein D9M70_532630 [compost metagenome]
MRLRFPQFSFLMLILNIDQRAHDSQRGAIPAALREPSRAEPAVAAILELQSVGEFERSIRLAILHVGGKGADAALPILRVDP